MAISKIKPEHWQSVKKIYIQGINTGLATFETESQISDYPQWIQTKIQNACYLFTHNHNVLGWAALSPVSDRCTYSGVAETSVYVDPSQKGKGIGKKLLQALIDYADNNGIWTLQAGIFEENEPSIALHKKLGFREVGLREKLGKLNNHWKNVLLLEKRSSTIL